MPLLRVELLPPNHTVHLTLVVVGVVGEVVIPAILLVAAEVVFLVAPLAVALLVGVPLILVALQVALQGVPLVVLPQFHAIRANQNMFLTEIWLSWLCTILN